MNPIDIIFWALAAVVVVFAAILIIAMIRSVFRKPVDRTQATHIIRHGNGR